jgi:hypothetical protein
MQDAATSNVAQGKRGNPALKHVVLGLPHPPNEHALVETPGLDEFGEHCSTYIKPELRYTSDESHTLNSYEYYAFMKWKNMITRKGMWENPKNRPFCMFNLRHVCTDYDFVHYFGDDVLDVDLPKPHIVAGKPLEVEPVHVDDISTFVAAGESRDDPTIGSTQEPQMFKTKPVKARSVDGTRVLKPLSEIMALVDARVREAGAATGLSLDPNAISPKSLEPEALKLREWPPASVWENHFKRETNEEVTTELQKQIDSNYAKIEELMKAHAAEISGQAERLHRASIFARLDKLVEQQDMQSTSPPSLAEDNDTESSPEGLETDVGSSMSEGDFQDAAEEHGVYGLSDAENDYQPGANPAKRVKLSSSKKTKTEL